MSMQVILQAQDSQLFQVSQSQKIQEFKNLVAQRYGVEIEDQIIKFDGQILNDERTFDECQISPLSVLTLCSKLLGGKVHGSLSRAGKVRNQTRKIEKQEKKKRKTGRCKRRIQYNKRFIAVAATTVGPRKGPNSNMK